MDAVTTVFVAARADHYSKEILGVTTTREHAERLADKDRRLRKLSWRQDEWSGARLSTRREAMTSTDFPGAHMEFTYLVTEHALRGAP